MRPPHFDAPSDPPGYDGNEIIQTLRRRAAELAGSNPDLAAELERAAEAHSDLIVRTGPVVAQRKLAEIRRR